MVSDMLSRSPTSNGRGTLSRAPGSILLSHKNLDTALTRAGAKPKAPQRIATWLDEVAGFPVPSGPEPDAPPQKGVSKLFSKLKKPFSKGGKGGEGSSEEGEDYFNTQMYDGVPEGGKYVAGQYIAPSVASSMNFGSEDSRFAPPQLSGFGFDRVEQRMDRLDRANELYNKLNKPKVDGQS
ncbi:hypothetical protein B0O99DRAFT_588139 [Bisporella sp. PMI_857]|nr:hypothetical protein B0O99DRAFT_588139 [Bisporella sp. PMI_857]